ncbi:MAG: potassium channel family protein, partial [Pseudomonadota bacterium]
MIILTLVSTLIAVGIVGYSTIENWSLDEALYMTMITVTTTGYQEVNPLSPSGRLFTIFLLAAGVCTLAFVSHLLLYELMSVDWNRLRSKKMLKKIANLEDHTIICGFGRMGKIICQELSKANVPFVVVDCCPESFEGAPENYLWIAGDATSDDLLVNAGIQRARALASMVDKDADSLYLTLAARSLNPEIKIISRVSQESAGVKVLRAGADQIVHPLLLSGKKVAKIVMAPEKESEAHAEIELSSQCCVHFEKITLLDHSEYWEKSVSRFQASSNC